MVVSNLESRIANLNSMLDDRGADFFVDFQQVTKQDGEWEGIKIVPVTPTDGCLSPVVYNNHEELDSLTDEELVNRLMGTYERSKGLSVNITKEYILDNVFPCLINSKRDDFRKNNDLFCRPLPQPTHQFWVYYRVPVDLEETSTGTLLVTNAIIDAFDIDMYELIRKASENAYTSYTLHTLEEVLGLSPDLLPVGDMPRMFIVSNERKLYGAGVIADEDVVHEIYGRLRNMNGGCRHYYIIPSSVHELLIIPNLNQKICPGEIADIIRQVNESQVNPVDQLGDLPLHFDGEEIEDVVPW